MATVAVIPARYASTRFPGKPLAKDTGQYLIQHVYDRVGQSASVDRVIVATDDERIVAAVRSFGGEVCLTDPDHATGTDRIAEAVASVGLGESDLVLNVQGDEPEIEAEMLDRLVDERSGADEAVRISTLAAPFPDDGPREGPGSPLDPNCVKVVLDERDRALYFSRSLIPFVRDAMGAVDRPSRWLLHLGVYLFRADTLRELTGGYSRSDSPLKRAESLEQLNWLERGFPIGVVVVPRGFVGIDTPEDYAAYVRRSGLPVIRTC